MSLRTLLAPHRRIAAEALRAYGPLRPGRVRGHGENTVFEVDGAPWMVRVHRLDYHSDPSILGELTLLQGLHEAGFTVPLPIEARDGSRLQVCEGRRVTVLKRVEGRIRRRIGGDRAAHLGRTLAGLHRFGLDWQPPAMFHRPRWDLPAILGPNAVWGDLETGGFDPVLAQELRNRLFDVLSALDDRAIPLHFDLHPGNVLWNGDVPGLIDWDDSGIGHPLFDLAIPWGRTPEAHRPRLLAGYGTPVDPDLLQAALLALDSRVVGWLHHRRDVPKLARYLPGFRSELTERVRAWMAT